MITKVAKTQMLFTDPWEWSGMYRVTTDIINVDSSNQEYWVSENGCGMEDIEQWVDDGGIITEEELEKLE